MEYSVEQFDKTVHGIKRRAKMFVEDNIPDPTPHDYLFIERAMLIGASIALEQIKRIYCS